MTRHGYWGLCVGLARIVYIHRICPYVCRVGQNRIYTPYMTVCFMLSLPKFPYIHRIVYIHDFGRTCVCVVSTGKEKHFAEGVQVFCGECDCGSAAY
jgi:hypothetical protein